MSITKFGRGEPAVRRDELTLEASKARQAVIDRDLAEFLAKGGQITRVSVSERACENVAHVAYRKMPRGKGL